MGHNQYKRRLGWIVALGLNLVFGRTRVDGIGEASGTAPGDSSKLKKKKERKKKALCRGKLARGPPGPHWILYKRQDWEDDFKQLGNFAGRLAMGGFKLVSYHFHLQD